MGWVSLTGQSSEFLKRFFAVYGMRLPVKGAHSYKYDDPFVILTSNYSLEAHVNSKLSNKNLRLIERSAFKEHLHEIELKTSIVPKEFDFWLDFMKSCSTTISKNQSSLLHIQ